MPIDPDNWTPAHGWAKVIRRTGIRLAIGISIWAALVWFLWPYTRVMARAGYSIGLVFVCSGFSGLVSAAVLGMPISRGADDATGLAGRALFLPLLGTMLVAIAITYAVIAAVRGDSNVYSMAMGFGGAGGALLCAGFWLAME